MKRIVILLVAGFGMSGCARQTTPPAPMQKSPPPAQQPTSAPKSVTQTATRFTGFSPDGKLFVVGLRHQEFRAGSEKLTGSLEIWDVGKRKKIARSQFSGPVVNVAFLTKKNLLLVSGGDISLCSPASGKVVKRLTTKFSPDVLALAPDQKSIAVLTNKAIEVRDTMSWKLRHKITVESPFAHFIRTMVFSPDSRRLVTGAWDVGGGIMNYDVRSGRKIWTSNGDQQGNVAWSVNGDRIAASVTVGVLLLRAKDGHLIKKWPCDYGGQVLFSPNGRQMIFTHNGMLVACDARSGKIVGKTRVENLSKSILSPDARMVAQISKDGSQVQFQQVKRARKP